MESKKRILCVDDEPINLRILEKILGKEYEVITANGGLEALEVLKNDPGIRLVISDMHMPGMNGLEFIREAQKRFSNKKYLVLSGYAKTEEIQKALDEQLIVEYFEKPADFEKIKMMLEDS